MSWAARSVRVWVPWVAAQAQVQVQVLVQELCHRHHARPSRHAHLPSQVAQAQALVQVPVQGRVPHHHHHHHPGLRVHHAVPAHQSAARQAAPPARQR